MKPLTDYDVFLFAEGRHHRLWEVLGAHFGLYEKNEGVVFRVWAPSAQAVEVIGDFNGWQAGSTVAGAVASSGIWEAFSSQGRPGDCYKFRIRTAAGEWLEKADPYARRTETPPRTASVISDDSLLVIEDSTWMENQTRWSGEDAISVYEVHLGTLRGDWGDKTYELAAKELVDRVVRLGFTHVEFMPVTEHPFGGSWGYQATSYFAPTARWGTPSEFAKLVESFHQAGVGVILDWVPGHFATDAFGLYRFDGSALYEHLDPRQGIHADWGSAIFNFGRNEVKSFLLSSAQYWVEVFHIDSLRVDAVASMLYLDYSREEWIPNPYGGRENLEAITFLKELNELVPSIRGGALTMAEESTAFPGVTQPTYLGGLGFGLKWNMGWMHDTLDYVERDPIHRRWHQNQLTFGLLYAFSENFILPISHDEVVHGKGSLYQKMPGDHWQKMANLRSLLAWMWGHPGKKLLFAGCEFAQREEWSQSAPVLELRDATPDAPQVELLVGELNAIYRSYPALFGSDFSSSGFAWSTSDDESNVVGFLRFPKDARGGDAHILVAANFSPVPRYSYRLGVSRPGTWKEILNTDSTVFGGSGVGNLGQAEAGPTPWGDHGFSLELNLPPLAVIFLCRSDS